MLDMGKHIVAATDRNMPAGSVWEVVFSPGPRPKDFPLSFPSASSGRLTLRELGFLPSSGGGGAPIGPQHDSMSQIHYAGHGQMAVLARLI